MVKPISHRKSLFISLMCFNFIDVDQTKYNNEIQEKIHIIHNI